ncbi:MAG TPA: hypothetical protein PKH33_05045, partial [bacterium]|nr:hypothetical protein [bacterium]
ALFDCASILSFPVVSCQPCFIIAIVLLSRGNYWHPCVARRHLKSIICMSVEHGITVKLRYIADIIAFL